ncbi:hypothetical protein EDM56_13010 [Brevibacillus fluminis]|uniref:Spore coat protein n=1 Tax=Brevibacillus fluminis TaxID=511487 RepID=A0A3M8DI05_9BACL|nr:hypothetical protein [Brevibacillus fluminis]RNB87750.1 hypothetical protein EDM56_13010 [Brevibacillus fluminis]
MEHALHEILEVHEITAFKTVCLTKTKTMQALVSDPALKQIMMQDLETSTRQLQELGAILSNAGQQELNS